MLLKEGAKIVSLKSFVTLGHVITEHNLGSPSNILRVEEYEFFSNSVSWTDAPGKYYVATVDRSMVKAYIDRMR